MEKRPRTKYRNTREEIVRFLEALNDLAPNESLFDRFNSVKDLNRAHAKCYRRIVTAGLQQQFSVLERLEGSQYVLIIQRRL